MNNPISDEIFSRNELFWGEECQKIFASKHIAVFGLGGVGGFCAETLARAGIGELTIVDFDKVSASNINRQIVALHSTIGKSKAELFKERLADINPQIKINVVDDFYTEHNDLAADIEFTYTLVGSMESNPDKGLLSVKSPLASGVLGKKEGEEFEAILPRGPKKYKLVKLEYK